MWLVSTGTRTMAYSAAISILGAFVIGFINFFMTELRLKPEDKSAGDVFKDSLRLSLSAAYEALQSGARNCITVAAACAMAGLIAGCITITGLASTLINVIVNFAGDATIIGLVLTMLTCIVLGMGVPTTANYCIMAATTAPILIALGIPQVPAHFFVFYFGIVADITPPVALGNRRDDANERVGDVVAVHYFQRPARARVGVVLPRDGRFRQVDALQLAVDVLQVLRRDHVALDPEPAPHVGPRADLRALGIAERVSRALDQRAERVGLPFRLLEVVPIAVDLRPPVVHRALGLLARGRFLEVVPLSLYLGPARGGGSLRVTRGR